MRGEILLVDAEGRFDSERLRAAGLRVYHVKDVAAAKDRMSASAADVIVVRDPLEGESLQELRRHGDSATSIIVVGRVEERESARRLGADSFLPATADVLYEIHRALILRRSGRRLPWNS
jgi:DNA-binding response OmpR family regulator